MKVVYLKGKSSEKDKNAILDNIKNDDTIFVYNGNGFLCDYIDNLEISSKNLVKLRICKEVAPINAIFGQNGKETVVNKLSDVIKLIDLKYTSEVIVLGDIGNDEEKILHTEIQLSDIMQQLIYVNIPLNKVQVLTEKEHRNNEKVRVFSEKIPKYLDTLKRSQELLSSGRFDSCFEAKKSVNSSLNIISECLNEAKENELIIATAASKKSGKSVIVNSILNNELAPTSLELATPNNCIYRKSKNGFTVEYNGEKRAFKDARSLKDYIFNIFKSAEMDIDAGYGIPDMNIGYASENNGFSSYTIYDTPGLDLAGAFHHKEAAKEAVNAADVVIFSIDYSKYLTDSELNYLKEIREIFKTKQKFYSLIINVNKMDCRYTNEGDKSSVRILDFIRNKLINVAPEFRDAIVIGTSALTYFDCLEIEKLDEYKELEKSNSFRDDLENIIELIADDPDKVLEVTALSFIYNMTSNLRTFDGIRVTDIGQIKTQSGMPNLLNYVEYIARGKARIEKVNRIIFTIENEYAKIQNLFHFQQLEEDLAENHELLDVAKKVLNDFQDEISAIYNENYYSDVNKIRDLEEGLSSDILIAIGNTCPFKLESIYDYCSKAYIDSMLDAEQIINYIINEMQKDKLAALVEELFDQTTQKRTIEGITRKVIKEDDLISGIKDMVTSIGDDVSIHISDMINKLIGVLDEENDKIKNDLSIIMNNRMNALQSAIDKCKNSLKAECGIQFELETPKFDFAFGNDVGEISNLINNESMVNEIKRVIDDVAVTKKKITEKGKLGSWIDSYFRNLVDSGFNRICYDKEYIIDELYQKNLKYNIKKYLELADIDKLVEPYKKDIRGEVKEFVDYIDSETAKLSEVAREHCESVRNVIDHTSDYETNIKNLQERRETLQQMQECVASFCSEWEKSMAQYRG